MKNVFATYQHQFQGQPQIVANPAMPENGGKYEIRFGDPGHALHTHRTRCK
jgi:hypothetical protein